MSEKSYTESWLTGPESTQFYTRTYVPASPPTSTAVVVFMHGFAEHVGRYTHFHSLLANQGITVFALDQRGFGLTGQDTNGKKSKSSSYGKTSWKDQMADIQWAVTHAKKTFEGLPVFLMGHSMGGGEVLGFATQGEDSPYQPTVSSLAGVIATSPLIEQATPAPKLLKWIGGKASILMPYTLIPAEVKAGDLSHDEAANSAYLKDPLIKQSGSLKGIHDMLTNGEALSKSLYRNWPLALPILIVHGTEDKVTSYKASQAFHDSIPAVKKKITLFEGGYHELQHEPNGVHEKLADEIVEFIKEHHSSAPSVDKESPTEHAQSTTETVIEPAHPTEAGPSPTGVPTVKSNM